MNFLTVCGDRIYGEVSMCDTGCAVTMFHVGDVIRKARRAKRWNQKKLGEKAAQYRLRDSDTTIDKSTVSAIEKYPFVSGFDYIVRLLATLGVPLAEAFKDVGEAPVTFTPAAIHSPPDRSAATKKRASRTTEGRKAS